MGKQGTYDNLYKKCSGWIFQYENRKNRMLDGEVILISLYYHIMIFTLKKKYNVILCYLKIMGITDLNLACRT